MGRIPLTGGGRMGWGLLGLPAPKQNNTWFLLINHTNRCLFPPAILVCVAGRGIGRLTAPGRD